MLRRLALAALGIGSLIVAFSGGGQIGFSVTYENGVQDVSAGTSPRALVAALIIVIALVVAMDPESDDRPGRAAASTLRRGVAWFLDLLLSLTAVSALVAFFPLVMEAIATGHFQWQFERNSATVGDWLVGLLGIIFLFAGMATYWGIPAVRAGQTIGQAVLGLRVVSATAEPLTLRACLLRGAMQPFAPLLWVSRFFSSKRSYFHDDVAHVQVVTTSSVEHAA